jgi:hypothetical protein
MPRQRGNVALHLSRSWATPLDAERRWLNAMRLLLTVGDGRAAEQNREEDQIGTDRGGLCPGLDRSAG